MSENEPEKPETISDHERMVRARRREVAEREAKRKAESERRMKLLSRPSETGYPWPKPKADA